MTPKKLTIGVTIKKINTTPRNIGRKFFVELTGKKVKNVNTKINDMANNNLKISFNVYNTRCHMFLKLGIKGE